MSFAGLLAHTATVEERAAGTDRFGQPEGAWQLKDGQLNISCRLRPASGRERTTLATRDALEVTHVVYLDANASVTEADRIIDVQDPDGDTLIAELDVVFVKRVSLGAGGTHHLEVLCREVQGG